MMKMCSQCGIEKMKTDFYFRNTNKNIEVNVYNVVVSNTKNGEMKTMKKILKNKIMKIIEKKTQSTEKNIMMRIVM